MIRVLLADDSPTALALLRAVLEEDGDLQVIAEARDGAEAVRLAQQLRPDLIIMDVEMPVADGLTATKRIMTDCPTPILIISAASARGVDLSLSATQAGALMALPKPDSPGSPRFEESVAELRSMARAMAQVKVVRHSATFSGSVRQPRPEPKRGKPVDVVAMAASTGGPAAVRHVLAALPPTFPTPVLLVQHIARDFAAGFADWLGSSCALLVKLAEHREHLRPGVVYVAPDDRHLGVSPDGIIQLSGQPPVGGFRPSATYCFESVGRAFGRRLVAVVMTGMGVDGAAGLVAARAAGAYVIAQDETTSVVYGMAQEAVRLGAVDVILPLPDIAPHLLEAVGRTADAH